MEGLYQTLDALLEGCQIIGFDWTYLYLNEAAAQASRRAREDLVGKKMVDVWPEFEGTKAYGLLRRCLEERVALQKEVEFVFPDGSKGWFDVRTNPVPEGIFILSIDISKRKEHEVELARLNRVYAALSHVNQSIVFSKTREDLFARICNVLVSHGEFPMVWIGLVEPLTRQVLPVASAGDPVNYLQDVVIYADDRPEGDGPTGTAIRSGKPYVCVDLDQDPRASTWREKAKRAGFGSSGAFPIRTGGVVCGALNVYASEPGFFKNREVALLEEAAVDISFALDNFARRAERDLAEATAWHESAFSAAMIESMPGIVYFYDERFRFRRWNSNFSAVSGYSGAEIANMQPLDFFAGSDRERVNDRIREVFEKGEASVEANFINKDGTSTPYLFTGRRLTFDGIACLVGVGVDISAHVKAQADLRSSEERFRQVVENIREVFWITDPDKSTMVYISPAYELIWGRTCASLYQSPQSWTDAIHVEDRARVIKATRNQKLENFDEVYRIERPDGLIRYIRSRAFPIKDDQGEVHRIVGIAEDITEHRNLEEQFRQSQKMEAIGQLAGGVAHDFNNVLAAIMMQAELAALVPGVPPDALQLLRDLQTSARRAAGLTRQLLAFSRKQVMQVRELDLNGGVTGLTKMLKRILGENIELRLRLHARPLFVEADAAMLDQVLLNLVLNARDAMKKGGELFIETSEKEFTADTMASIPIPAPGRYAVLRVIDSGEGIPIENISHIFEPFFTTKDPGRGTGLGLATVFGIVNQHHGAVLVRSEVGRGTTFEIFIPATGRTEEITQTKLPATRPSEVGTGTILLVEDETKVRQLTRTILEKNGYDVIEASSGAEALEIFSQISRPIHLLLTDLVMPGGVTGFELAAQIRAEQPDMKVIFTSGYSPETAGQRIQLQPGQDFIQKPASAEEILDVIHRALRG